jgi:hypothetical protein
MGNTIVSFEDFQKKSKSGLKEDTIMPTGNSTVFVDGGGEEEEHHSGEEKNYMFFKNLHTMKRCIEEIMAMDKEQVDEMIEKGHDWASDHISSSKDDLQEVCDWLRYEIDNYESGEDDGEDDGEEDNENQIDLSKNEVYRGICTLFEDEDGNNILEYISLLHTELIGINKSLENLKLIRKDINRIAEAAETFFLKDKKSEKHDSDSKKKESSSSKPRKEKS